MQSAALPALCFCWCCCFCRGRAGAAVISDLVKTHRFARTSYFQQSTQDCCAVAVCGYSCISSLLLMETELQGCFSTWKRAERRAVGLPLHLLLLPDPVMQRSQLPSRFMMFLAETGHTREAIWQRRHTDHDFRHSLTQRERAKKCLYNI